MRRFCVKRNIFAVLVVALTLVLGFATIASADVGALQDFNAQYPGNSFGNSCNICHKSIPKTNAYGKALFNAGATANNVPSETFVAVEELDSDGDGFTNIEEINAGTFPGNPNSHPEATITITAPVAGQVIPSGRPFTIVFDASPEISSVKVKYSLNKGATWLPAVGTSNAGSFDWTVPTLQKNTRKALVKVIGFNASNVKLASDKSDAFTIEVVSITAPVADEIVTGGSIYPVTWNTNVTKRPVSTAKVFYTFGSSGIWKAAKGTVVDVLGSFDWNVPSPAKAKIVKLKVVLKDDRKVIVGIALSGAFIVQ
jgi:hypothetical protein